MKAWGRRRWFLGTGGALLLGGAGLAIFHWDGPGGRVVGAPGSEAILNDREAAAYAALEQQVRHRPRDGRAWVLKARADLAAGRHEMAVKAYAKALEVGRNVAKDAGVWLEYAEARGMAQGGSLAGEPQKLIQHALALSPTHPQALDLAGSAAWETNDFEAAARYWRRLQQQLPQSDPRQADLARAVQTAERRVKFNLPSQAPSRSP